MRGISYVLALLPLTLACSQQKQEPPPRLAELRQEYEAKTARLSEELRILRLSVYQGRTFLPQYETERLKKLGLVNPSEEILTSLEKQNSLLRDNETSRFGFYGSESFVVRPGLVLGYFDDGHSSGYALLDYRVTQAADPGSESKIQWKLRCKVLD